MSDSPEKKEEAGYGLKYVLSTHFFQLMAANFLCVVFSIPILTIPAAVSGLHAVVQQYYRTGYGDLWDTFITGFKTDFFQRLVITAGLLLIPGIGFFLGSLFGSFFPMLLLALFSVFTLLVLAWFFPQLPLLQLPPLTALKNAVLLTMLEPVKNLLLLMITLLCFAPMLLLMPFSAFLLFCVYPLFPVLLRTAITDGVLQERLVTEGACETKN